jgi:hypothetical protein
MTGSPTFSHVKGLFSQIKFYVAVVRKMENVGKELK